MRHASGLHSKPLPSFPCCDKERDVMQLDCYIGRLVRSCASQAVYHQLLGLDYMDSAAVERPHTIACQFRQHALALHLISTDI